MKTEQQKTSQTEKQQTDKFMTIKHIAFLGLIACTGCGGSSQLIKVEERNSVERLEDWGVKDKAALGSFASAKTEAEIAQAIDKLAEAAETAPIPEARAMAEKDVCLAAGAAADAATLIRFNCEAGVLKPLIGGY